MKTLPTRMCSLCGTQPAEVTHHCAGLRTTSTAVPVLTSTDVALAHEYFAAARHLDPVWLPTNDDSGTS